MKMTKFGLSMLVGVVVFSASAFADNCVGQICVGKRVIDSSDYIGVVNSVGLSEVTYTIPGYSASTANPNELSPEVVEKGSMKAGVTVIDTSQYIGTVNHIFQNGKVQYTIPGYNPSVANISSLSAVVKSVGQIQIGSTVIDSSQYIGTVQQIFENGDVQYVIQGYNPSIAQASTLSVKVDSVGALSAQVLVIDSSDYIGTVQQVFANGLVQYTIPGYNASITQASTLSPQVTACPTATDITAGVTVIDSSNYIGVVKKVFANGKVQYAIPGYNASVAVVGSLSPEVSSNPQYQKGVYYATSQFTVGKANRFFKNGMVELVRDDGYRSVGQKLASLVQQLNGYSAGTAIVTPSALKGTATLIFSNGTVEYSYLAQLDPQNPSAQKKRIADGKQIGIDPAQQELDDMNWIRGLQSYLWCTINNSPAACSESFDTALLDKTSDLPVLKKRVLALLQKKPNLIWNDQIRAQAIALLSQP